MYQCPRGGHLHAVTATSCPSGKLSQQLGFFAATDHWKQFFASSKPPVHTSSLANPQTETLFVCGGGAHTKQHRHSMKTQPFWLHHCQQSVPGYYNGPAAQHNVEPYISTALPPATCSPTLLLYSTHKPEPCIISPRRHLPAPYLCPGLIFISPACSTRLYWCIWGRG